MGNEGSRDGSRSGGSTDGSSKKRQRRKGKKENPEQLRTGVVRTKSADDADSLPMRAPTKKPPSRTKSHDVTARRSTSADNSIDHDQGGRNEGARSSRADSFDTDSFDSHPTTSDVNRSHDTVSVETRNAAEGVYVDVSDVMNFFNPDPQEHRVKLTPNKRAVSFDQIGASPSTIKPVPSADKTQSTGLIRSQSMDSRDILSAGRDARVSKSKLLEGLPSLQIFENTSMDDNLEVTLPQDLMLDHAEPLISPLNANDDSSLDSLGASEPQPPLPPLNSELYSHDDDEFMSMEDTRSIDDLSLPQEANLGFPLSVDASMAPSDTVVQEAVLQPHSEVQSHGDDDFHSVDDALSIDDPSFMVESSHAVLATESLEHGEEMSQDQQELYDSGARNQIDMVSTQPLPAAESDSSGHDRIPDQNDELVVSTTEPLSPAVGRAGLDNEDFQISDPKELALRATESLFVAVDELSEDGRIPQQTGELDAPDTFEAVQAFISGESSQIPIPIAALAASAADPLPETEEDSGDRDRTAEERHELKAVTIESEPTVLGSDDSSNRILALTWTADPRAEMEHTGEDDVVTVRQLEAAPVESVESVDESDGAPRTRRPDPTEILVVPTSGPLTETEEDGDQDSIAREQQRYRKVVGIESEQAMGSPEESLSGRNEALGTVGTATLPRTKDGADSHDGTKQVHHEHEAATTEIAQSVDGENCCQPLMQDGELVSTVPKSLVAGEDTVHEANAGPTERLDTLNVATAESVQDISRSDTGQEDQIIDEHEARDSLVTDPVPVCKEDSSDANAEENVDALEIEPVQRGEAESAVASVPSDDTAPESVERRIAPSLDESGVPLPQMHRLPSELDVAIDSSHGFFVSTSCDQSSAEAGEISKPLAETEEILDMVTGAQDESCVVQSLAAAHSKETGVASEVYQVRHRPTVGSPSIKSRDSSRYYDAGGVSIQSELSPGTPRFVLNDVAGIDAGTLGGSPSAKSALVGSLYYDSREAPKISTGEALDQGPPMCTIESGESADSNSVSSSLESDNARGSASAGGTVPEKPFVVEGDRRLEDDDIDSDVEMNNRVECEVMNSIESIPSGSDPSAEDLASLLTAAQDETSHANDKASSSQLPVVDVVVDETLAANAVAKRLTTNASETRAPQRTAARTQRVGAPVGDGGLRDSSSQKRPVSSGFSFGGGWKNSVRRFASAAASTAASAALAAAPVLADASIVAAELAESYRSEGPPKREGPPVTTDRGGGSSVASDGPIAGSVNFPKAASTARPERDEGSVPSSDVEDNRNSVSSLSRLVTTAVSTAESAASVAAPILSEVGAFAVDAVTPMPKSRPPPLESGQGPHELKTVVQVGQKNDSEDVTRDGCEAQEVVPTENMASEGEGSMSSSELRDGDVSTSENDHSSLGRLFSAAISTAGSAAHAAGPLLSEARHLAVDVVAPKRQSSARADNAAPGPATDGNLATVAVCDAVEAVVKGEPATYRDHDSTGSVFRSSSMTNEDSTVGVETSPSLDGRSASVQGTFSQVEELHMGSQELQLQINFPPSSMHRSKRSDAVSLSSASSTMSPGSTTRGMLSSGMGTPAFGPRMSVGSERGSVGDSKPPLFPKKTKNVADNPRKFVEFLSKKLAAHEVTANPSGDNDTQWMKQPSTMSFDPQDSVFERNRLPPSLSLSPPGSPPEPKQEGSDLDETSLDGSKDSLTRSVPREGRPEVTLWDMISVQGGPANSVHGSETGRPEYVVLPEPSSSSHIAPRGQLGLGEWGQTSITASSELGSSTRTRNRSLMSDTSLSSTRGRKRMVKGFSFTGRAPSRRTLASRAYSRRRLYQGTDMRPIRAVRSEEVLPLFSPKYGEDSDTVSLGAHAFSPSIYQRSTHDLQQVFSHSVSSPDLRLLSPLALSDGDPTPIFRPRPLDSPGQNSPPVDLLLRGRLPNEIRSVLSSTDLSQGAILETPIGSIAGSIEPPRRLSGGNARLSQGSESGRRMRALGERHGEDTGRIPLDIPMFEEVLLERSLLAFSSVKTVRFPCAQSKENLSPSLEYLAFVKWQQLVAQFKHREMMSFLTRRQSFPSPSPNMDSGSGATPSTNYAKRHLDKLELCGLVVGEASDFEGSIPPTSFLSEIGAMFSVQPVQGILRHETDSSMGPESTIDDLIHDAQYDLERFSSLVQNMAGFAAQNDIASLDDGLEAACFSIGIKPRESIEKKSTRKYSRDFLQVKDILRGQIIFPDEGSLVCALVFANRICSQGAPTTESKDTRQMGLVRFKNSFAEPRDEDPLPFSLPTGYGHVLLTVRLASGLLAEIQCHLGPVYDVLGEEGYSLHREIIELEDILTRERQGQEPVTDPFVSFPTGVFSKDVAFYRLVAGVENDSIDIISLITEAAISQPDDSANRDTDEVVSPASPVSQTGSLDSRTALQEEPTPLVQNKVRVMSPTASLTEEQGGIPAPELTSTNTSIVRNLDSTYGVASTPLEPGAIPEVLDEDDVANDDANYPAPLSANATSENHADEAGADQSGTTTAITTASDENETSIGRPSSTDLSKTGETPHAESADGTQGIAAEPIAIPVDSAAPVAADAVPTETQRPLHISTSFDCPAPTLSFSEAETPRATGREVRQFDMAGFSGETPLQTPTTYLETPVGCFSAPSDRAEAIESLTDGCKGMQVFGFYEALLRRGGQAIQDNPRDAPSLYCMYALFTFLSDPERYESADSLNCLVSREQMIMYSQQCLLQCWILSNQAVSTGMMGWMEYDSMQQHGKDIERPLTVHYGIACTFARNQMWTDAEDVLKSLVVARDHHFPQYHPRTLTTLLDLAAVRSMTADTSSASQTVSEVSKRLGTYLSMAEDQFLSRRDENIADREAEDVVFRTDHGRDWLSTLAAFVSSFEKLLGRDMVKTMGPEHDVTLVHHCLLADSLVVLANCIGTEKAYSRPVADASPANSGHYWQEALLHYQYALQGFTQTKGPTDPNVSAAAFGAARCLRELGRSEEALEILSTVVEVSEQDLSTQPRGSTVNANSLDRKADSDRERSSFLPRRCLRQRQVGPSKRGNDENRRLSSALCFWLMAALTADLKPSKQGRDRSLSLLHSASKLLQNGLRASPNMVESTRVAFIEMLQRIEAEARYILDLFDSTHMSSEAVTPKTSHTKRPGHPMSSPPRPKLW